MEAYKQLTEVFRRLHRLDHFYAISEWDMSVNMPEGSVNARADALSELASLRHNILVDTKLKDLIIEVTKPGYNGVFSAVENANIREMHRIWDKENKLSDDFVRQFTLACKKAEGAWRICREQNDWNTFLPYFKNVLHLAKEKGRMLADGTSMTVYEALLGEFEPGVRVENIKRYFDDIKQWLPSLIKEVLKKQENEGKILPLPGPFSIEKQKDLGLKAMRTWNFDFSRGRIDISAHPFCGGVPEDVRITTRYTEENFHSSFLGVVHETGHAKYEQNRPQEWLEQPVSEARSMGMHESQSLFAEMQIGHSPAFVTFILPYVKAAFPENYSKTPEAFSPENFYRNMNIVNSGLIRIDADELTYPLHIILRFEIEMRLFDETLEPEQIPNLWNELMSAYLGIETQGNERDGCLQDIHWSMGSFGYFPTYTLGAMYAAQFMHACRAELGESFVDECIREGKLEPILEWQRKNIWSKGSMFSTEEILIQATGSPLDTNYFRKHLTKRYAGRDV